MPSDQFPFLSNRNWPLKHRKKSKNCLKRNIASRLQRFPEFSSRTWWCFPHRFRRFRWNPIISRDRNHRPGQLSGYSTAVWHIQNFENAPSSPLRDVASPAGDVTSLICSWEARNNEW
jgi:hypothetical protein